MDTKHALTTSDSEVGPACMNVPVPPTIAMDDAFRESYVQGYRHALNDARKILVAYMPVPRCETCAHWKDFKNGTGLCKQIDQLSTPVPANFGCVEHKEK